ncbi:MAG: hypothetical protein K5650_02820, partial [Bacteroidales bacterium]|nr:hypothetical protein [Bacteroidales bacterium]
QGLVMRVTGIKQPVNSPRSIELTLTNAIVLKYNWVKQLSQTVQEVRLRRRPRPINPLFPRGVVSALDEVLAEEVLDASGNLLDLRRKVATPYAKFSPVKARVSTLELNRTQLLNKLNNVITRVNDNTNRFIALKSAIDTFDTNQGSGNKINFDTCIDVSRPGDAPVCRSMNDIAQLELLTQ